MTKKTETKAIENSILINVARCNLEHKIRNRVHAGNVYLVRASVHRETENTAEDIETTFPVYKDSAERYVIIPQDPRAASDEYLERNFTTREKLIERMLNFMQDNHMFDGKITRAVKIEIVRYAGSINEYYNLKNVSEDEFNMVDYVKSMRDGLYWAYDNSNRRKADKQPPFMFMKRNGSYTIIDVDMKTNFTFSDDNSPESIIARATLNFGGCYTITAVKR